MRYNIISLSYLIVKAQGDLKSHFADIIAYNDKIWCGEVKFFGNFNFFIKFGMVKFVKHVLLLQ